MHILAHMLPEFFLLFLKRLGNLQFSRNMRGEPPMKHMWGRFNKYS